MLTRTTEDEGLTASCGQPLLSCAVTRTTCATTLVDLLETTLNRVSQGSENTHRSYRMDNFLTLPPEIASELTGFVRHTMTCARMRNCRLARDASSLTSEQAHMLADAHQLGAIIRTLVDDTILSTVDRLKGRNDYPLPEDLPAEILSDIWNHLDFRDRFAVTGVCRSWRNIGIGTPLHWQDIEFVATSHSELCSCKQCSQAKQKLGSGGNDLGRIHLALTRGGQCDLHLVMKMVVGGIDREFKMANSSAFVDFMAEISVHIERIRSLTYVTDSLEYLRHVLSGKLPRLKVFKLQAIDNHSEITHGEAFSNGWFSPWVFGVDAPQLEQFGSSIGGVVWPILSGYTQFPNVTRISIGVRDGVGGLISVFAACPQLEHAKFIIRQLDLSRVFPSDALGQVRSLKTIAIVGVHNHLESNELQNEREVLWQSLLSLQAQDIAVEYALDEDPYVVPSHGLGFFSPNSRSGGFAVEVVCLSGEAVAVSRKDIIAVTSDVVHFSNIPGPIRTISFHGAALPEVLGSASDPWLADVWILYLQLGECNFDNSMSRIIAALPRMIAVSTLILSAPTELRCQQFIASVRMSSANLPNLRVVHIITPRATTTELLSATT